MISMAFTLVSGTEFMITRSDSPHTALLRTTDDCLGGQTFRDKIHTGYVGGGIKDSAGVAARLHMEACTNRPKDFNRSITMDASRTHLIFWAQLLEAWLALTSV